MKYKRNMVQECHVAFQKFHLCKKLGQQTVSQPLTFKFSVKFIRNFDF